MANRYTEPDSFIPKNIRKQFGLGEFNKDTAAKKTTSTTKKKTTGKKK